MSRQSLTSLWQFADPPVRGTVFGATLPAGRTGRLFLADAAGDAIVGIDVVADGGVLIFPEAFSPWGDRVQIRVPVPSYAPTVNVQVRFGDESFGLYVEQTHCFSDRLYGGVGRVAQVLATPDWDQPPAWTGDRAVAPLLDVLDPSALSRKPRRARSEAYGIVLGADALALMVAPEPLMIVLERDTVATHALEARLRAQGLAGRRVYIHHDGSGHADLPRTLLPLLGLITARFGPPRAIMSLDPAGVAGVAAAAPALGAIDRVVLPLVPEAIGLVRSSGYGRARVHNKRTLDLFGPVTAAIGRVPDHAPGPRASVPDREVTVMTRLAALEDIAASAAAARRSLLLVEAMR